MKLFAVCALAALVLAPVAGRAEDPRPDGIVVYFDAGSAAIRAQEEAALDKAARTYRDGNPIVMLVTASTDATGGAQANLILSERRANAVVAALVARGIPVQKLQVLGKGATEVASASGADDNSRRAEITWR